MTAVRVLFLKAEFGRGSESYFLHEYTGIVSLSQPRQMC